MDDPADLSVASTLSTSASHLSYPETLPNSGPLDFFYGRLERKKRKKPENIFQSLWDGLCTLQEDHEKADEDIHKEVGVPRWAKRGLQPPVSVRLLPVDQLSILLGPLGLFKNCVVHLNLLQQAKETIEEELLELNDSITQSKSAKHFARCWYKCLTSLYRIRPIMKEKELEVKEKELEVREKELENAKLDVSRRLWYMWQTLMQEGRKIARRRSPSKEPLSQFHTSSLKTLRVSVTIKGKIISALADTGSEENIISRKLAMDMGCTINSGARSCKKFVLADGRTIAAIGKITTDCSFVKGAKHKQRCTFYVLSEVIEDLIMGCRFLQDTETMTKYGARLEECTMLGKPCQVMHLSRAQIVKRCYVNRKLTDAYIDTGSMVDLISPQYAKAIGCKIQSIDPDEQAAQQADGSLVSFIGKTVVNFKSYHSLINDENRRFKQQRIFYVLDGLSCDVLLGQQLWSQMRAFTNAFLEEKTKMGRRLQTTRSYLYVFRWLGPWEQKIANVLGSRSQRQITRSPSSPVVDTSQPSFGRRTLDKLTGRRRDRRETSHDAEMEYYRRRDLDDARENERKDQADKRIEAMADVDERIAARAEEEVLRTRYRQSRAEREQEYWRATAVAANDHRAHVNVV